MVANSESRAGRVAPRQLIWSLVATGLWAGVLAGTYNLYKHAAREATRGGLAPETKAAIREFMPWSIALFALVALGLAWGLRSLPEPRRRWLALAACLVAQNAAALLRGLPAVIVVNAAFLLGALAWALLVPLTRAWRGWHTFAGRRLGRPRSSNLMLAVPYAGSVLLTALCLAQLSRQWGNTLHDNGRWIAVKTEQEVALLGAVAFVVTRKAVAQERLDLAAWHGYHELVYRDTVDADTLRARFRLDRDAYVVVRYGAAEAPFEAVRLSRHAHFPSSWLRVAEDGVFVARAPLAWSGAGTDTAGAWHQLELAVADGLLTIDGEAIGRCPWPIGAPQRIGFRNGKHGAWIDDVEVRQRDGSILREGFDLPPFRGQQVAGATAALLALGGAVSWLARRGAGGNRPALFAPIAVSVPLLLGAVAFTTLDYWVLARARPLSIDYRGFETAIETQLEVVHRTRNEHSRAAGGRRVVVLGSSQTWGSGSRTIEDAWVSRLGSHLNRAEGRRGEEPWRCVNGGISGASSGVVFETYRREWAEPRPHLVLVVLSHNDRDRDAFRRNLEELATSEGERGVPLVFVLEPDSIEDVSPDLLPNHEVVGEVGAAHGVPVIDMMGKLAPYEDRGHLWWDHVHMSSCGQRFFAEILIEELKKLGLPNGAR